MIRIDGRTLQWMGDNIRLTDNGSELFTTTVTREITPTRSIFRLKADAVQFNVTFLSPIEVCAFYACFVRFSNLRGSIAQ